MTMWELDVRTDTSTPCPGLPGTTYPTLISAGDSCSPALIFSFALDVKLYIIDIVGMASRVTFLRFIGNVFMQQKLRADELL